MITVDELKLELSYDPKTGEFWWLRSDKGRRMWRPAGRTTKGRYVTIGIFNETYYGHHLAWLYMTGTWAESEIDHKNTVRHDNHWNNLRLATTAQNRANANLRKDNTSDKLSAELLIKEHFALQDKIKEATKLFMEYLAPSKKRLDEIDAQLLQLLNSLTTGDKKSISTDVGTCYVSNLLNVSVDPELGEPYVNEAGEKQTGRMALLDWCLANWDDYGADMLLVSPQKDAVKRHLDEHGKPPPGLKISYFARVNVRRS